MWCNMSTRKWVILTPPPKKKDAYRQLVLRRPTCSHQLVNFLLHVNWQGPNFYKHQSGMLIIARLSCASTHTESLRTLMKGNNKRCGLNRNWKERYRLVERCYLIIILQPKNRVGHINLEKKVIKPLKPWKTHHNSYILLQLAIVHRISVIIWFINSFYTKAMFLVTHQSFPIGFSCKFLGSIFL